MENEWPICRAMTTPDGLPPVRVVEITDPYWREEHEAAWRGLCKANSRLFDGPIWSVRVMDTRELVVSLDRYKRLAVQACGFELHVRQLGVKGFITGVDRAGVEHVLLARRGEQTRTYPGEWEIAPAGGVEPHDGPLSEAIDRSLVDEGREELGTDLNVVAGVRRVVAMLHDRDAHSIEIIVACRWKGTVEVEHPPVPSVARSWECSGTRWVSRSEFDSMTGLSSPTSAVLSLLWHRDNGD